MEREVPNWGGGDTKKECEEGCKDLDFWFMRRELLIIMQDHRYLVVTMSLGGGGVEEFRVFIAVYSRFYFCT